MADKFVELKIKLHIDERLTGPVPDTAMEAVAQALLDDLVIYLVISNEHADLPIFLDNMRLAAVAYGLVVEWKYGDAMPKRHIIGRDDESLANADHD